MKYIIKKTKLHISESHVAGFVVQSSGEAGRRCVFRPVAVDLLGSQSQQAINFGAAREDFQRAGGQLAASRAQQYITVERTFADTLLKNSTISSRLLFIYFSQVPELPFRRLQSLYLAHNELASIPAEMSSNLSSLHNLDLSHNDLTVVPLITHTLPRLKRFNLGYNPITSITNTSFLGLAESLEELDIRHLMLNTFEVDLYTISAQFKFR